jgi:hypothetical protein
MSLPEKEGNRQMETRLLGHRRLLVVLAPLCAFIALACQVSISLPGSESTESTEATAPAITPLSEADEQLVLNAFLHERDLPEGWYLDYFGIDASDGNPVYAIAFRVAHKLELDYIFVAQEIVLYENESEAKEAYTGKWNKSVGSVAMGQPPSEIAFVSRADEFAVGCLYSTTALQPENFCGAVARYGRLISILTTKTWDEDDAEQWFTWADFEGVLKAMDRRALEAQGIK